MCGIFGFIKNRENLNNQEIEYSRKKTKELNYRGPDSYGEWKKDNKFIGVQRLSINDLTETGDQPFLYEDKALVFNGEIYNYLELKKELEKIGYTFKSSGDTEVFFKFLIEFGIDKLEKVNGMFSFIFFDGTNVHFGNDIFSEKTLFYYKDQSKLIISSELKNINDLSTKSNDKEIIFSYLSFGHLIKEDTFYKNIYKLLPGQILTLTENFSLKKIKFFDPKNYYLNNRSRNSGKIDTNYFFEKIEKAINLRFTSDREIGVFFSGGLDSSIVTNHYLDFKKKNLVAATYTNDKNLFLNENENNTYLKPIFITDDDIELNNNAIISLFGQPQDSFTSLAIESLSKLLANNNIKCALSGMGGDELFFGYNKFYDHENIKFKLNRLLKLGFRKFDQSLFSKNVTISSYIHSNQYLNWINEVFKFNNNYSVVENIFFNDIEFFLPNSRCLTNDVASMKHSVELRGSFLDIDLLKSILNFDIRSLADLGTKKILLDFYKNKGNSFKNYRKYPFLIRPKKQEYSNEDHLNFVKSIFPKIKDMSISDEQKDKIDLLLTFYN